MLTVFTIIALADGLSPSTICTLVDDSGSAVVSIAVEECDSEYWLTSRLATTYSARPLLLAFPTAKIGYGREIAIAVRYTGVNLQLFVDGVIVDEEWPAGAVSADLSTAASTDGRDLTVWSKALGEDEIVALCGGAAFAAKRANDMLGAEPASLSYWRPRGYKTGVGDCMPFFNDGRFHLFYLFDRHQHRSKWDKGAHQWAHASTTDLVTWTYHPLAIPISAEWEGSICTGSVFHWDGIYRAYFAVRTIDGSPAPLMEAVSRDAIMFTKTTSRTILSEPYDAASVRDPVVFRDDNSGLFHMLVTTSTTRAANASTDKPRRDGCLAHLTSTNLAEWQQCGTFFESGVDGETDWNAEPECPDYFRWGDWYYLVFSVDGYTRYRISDNPFGPWRRLPVDGIDGPQLSVMKTAVFGENRRLAVGFLGDHGYGGQVVMRDLIQHADGSLGTRFTPELLPPSGEPSRYPGCDAAGHGHATISAGVPANARVHLRLTPLDSATTYEIALRGSDIDSHAHMLTFDAAAKTVTWRHTLNGETDPASPRDTLPNVTDLEKPISLDIIMLNDILDIEVNNRRTFVVRAPCAASCSHTMHVVSNGSVSVDDIIVWPITRNSPTI